MSLRDPAKLAGPPCEEARQSVFHYIEMFYNPTRRHQTLAWISPIEFEADYHNRLTTSAEPTQKEATTTAV